MYVNVLRPVMKLLCRYGLIRDATLFEWLEANMGRILARDAQAAAYAVKRSCINKAEVRKH